VAGVIGQVLLELPTAASVGDGQRALAVRSGISKERRCDRGKLLVALVQDGAVLAEPGQW
jgi:hypothetical protein